MTITSTVEYPLNTDTSEIAKNLQALAKNAGVTLTGGAGVENVSVVAGAIQASIEGDTLYLASADATPKASANFSLPANISLPAFTNATVQASRLGDGVISAKGNNFVSVATLTADTFQLTGRKEGSTDLGFWLAETATYYGAAKNLPVVVTENPMPIYFDFEDATDLFKNTGYAQILTNTADLSKITTVDDSGYGTGISTGTGNSMQYYDLTTNVTFGNSDCTATARLHSTDDYGSLVVLYQGSNWGSGQKIALTTYVLNSKQIIPFRINGNEHQFNYETNVIDWHEVKVVYLSAEQKAECYVDGDLVHTFTGVVIPAGELNLRYGGTLDEVQVFS